MSVPVADAIQVAGHTPTKSLLLRFRVPDGKDQQVLLSASLTRILIEHIAAHLLHAPVPEMKAIAQVFAIRELEATLHQQTPTLKYEVEAGMQFQTSIGIEEAHRLHQQLGTILQHLDSLGTPTKQ